jgi:hypothetical protein
MDIALNIHVERSEAGTPVWWADSDDLPGMTASANSLAELRTALAELLEEFGSELVADVGHPGEDITIVSESLVGADFGPGSAPGPLVTRDGKPEERRQSPVQVLIPA